MAADEASGGDRTEAASPRRLERAREAGQVPISRDLATFVSLSAAVAGLSNYVLPNVAVWSQTLQLSVVQAGRGVGDDWGAAFSGYVTWLRFVWPPLVAASVCGSIAFLAQTKLLVRLKSVTPQIDRISPMSGIKRLVGMAAWAESLKSICKLLILTTAIYLVAKRELFLTPALPLQSLYVSSAQIASTALHMLYAGCGVQGIFGGIDLVWVRYKHARDLRMSKQDLRDEFKESEGSPHVKAKVRQVIFARSRRRMMAAVPKANVVITNPTHYAVALAYNRGADVAPRLVAKGVDRVAAKIRAVATAASVPVVANPPLARALHQLDVDTEISPEHFKAVAQIIAYVWRLRHERPKFS
jgi:flagellar biosynthesis protein FlhB